MHKNEVPFLCIIFFQKALAFSAHFGIILLETNKQAHESEVVKMTMINTKEYAMIQLITKNKIDGMRFVKKVLVGSAIFDIYQRGNRIVASFGA
jgi:very-short-patch-repair endonuclease